VWNVRKKVADSSRRFAPVQLLIKIKMLTGVVEVGLFTNMCKGKPCSSIISHTLELTSPGG
jgi:ribose 5-phosphate isomerase